MKNKKFKLLVVDLVAIIGLCLFNYYIVELSVGKSILYSVITGGFIIIVTEFARRKYNKP